jgi:hypothetical protein
MKLRLVDPDVIAIAAPPVSKELRERWSYFIQRLMKPIRLVVPSVARRCGLSVSLTSRTSLKKSFNA